MRTCDLEGCDRKHEARGLCVRHYKRLKNTGTTSPRVRPSGCSVDGCDSKPCGHGLCSMHYTRFWRTGTTDKSGKRKDWRGVKLLSPDGVEHTITISVRAFCMERGLKEQNMMKVLIGQRRHHMDWTCPGAGFVPKPRHMGGRGRAPYRACSIEGCERDSKTSDLCGMHRQRIRKFGRTYNINRGYGNTALPDTRRCNKCGEEKPLGLFHKAGFYVDGGQKHKGNCQDCIRAYTDKYYTENLDAVLEKGRRWKRDNLVHCREYSKKYFSEHPEQMREWKAENCKQLKDSYVRNTFRRLGVNNPPKKLIELKRTQMRITRELRTMVTAPAN